MWLALLLGLGLSLRAAPAQLVLGRDAAAALEVSVDGELPEGAQVAFWASAGKVGPVESLPGGKFRARYTPPSEKFPQVALLSATLEEKPGSVARAWLALPLSGSDVLALDTRPGAKVTVSVGGRVVGERRADRLGRVQVPIVVPPGVRTATVRVLDRFGNLNEKALDLAPPPFARLHLVVDRDAASWADAEPLGVEVFAVNPSGEPIAATELLLSAERGSLGRVTERAPGVFSAAYRAPPQVGNGKDIVRAQLSGEEQSDAVELRIVPGPPGRVDVTATPAELVAFSANQAQIHAAVQDARGNELPADSIDLDADFGALDRREKARAVLRVPNSFEGRTEVRVRGSASGVEGEVAIPLRAGPAARGSLLLPRRELREGDTIEATVELRDEAGNPVPGARLSPAETAGFLGEPRDLGGGRYALPLRFAPGTQPGRRKFIVRADRVELTEEVVLVAGKRPYALSAGLLLQGRSNFSHATGGGLTLEAALDTPVLGRRIEWLARGELLQFVTARVPYAGEGSGVFQTAAIQALTLSAGARANWPLAGSFAAHASILLGAMRAFDKVGIDGGPAAGPAEQDARWSPLGALAAGASFRHGPGRFIGEMALSSAPARGPLAGNLGGFSLSAGYLLDVR